LVAVRPFLFGLRCRGPRSQPKLAFTRRASYLFRPTRQCGGRRRRVPPHSFRSSGRTGRRTRNSNDSRPQRSGVRSRARIGESNRPEGGFQGETPPPACSSLPQCKPFDSKGRRRQAGGCSFWVILHRLGWDASGNDPHLFGLRPHKKRKSLSSSPSESVSEEALNKLKLRAEGSLASGLCRIALVPYSCPERGVQPFGLGTIRDWHDPPVTED